MSNKNKRRSNSKYFPSWIEKGIAYIAALTVLGVSLFLIIRNEKFADQNLFIITRIIISFSIAVLGATVPGFLQLSWEGKGLIIRAGGALALFVLTLFVYPPSPPNDLPRPSDDQNIPATHQETSNLEIVDVNYEENVVDIKLQNSGENSAFITEAKFIQKFAYIGCCSCVYDGHVAATTYEYSLGYTIFEEETIQKAPIRSFLDNLSTEYKNDLPTINAENYCSLNSNQSDSLNSTEAIQPSNQNQSLLEQCKSHYLFHTEGDLTEEGVQLPSINLSQEVPGGGVDRIKFSFNLPNRNEFNQLDTGSQTLVMEGYAILYYGPDDKTICTPNFAITFNV